VPSENSNLFIITYTLQVAKEKKTRAKVLTQPESLELTYNGKEQALVKGGKAEGGTMLYALGADAKSAPAADAFGVSAPVGTDAGTYYVWYYVQGDVQHTDTDFVCMPVAIDKANLVIEADGVEGIVGDGDKAIEAAVKGVSGKAAGVALSFKVIEGVDVASVDAATGKLMLIKPGTATVRVTAAGTTNYSEATKDVTVHVHGLVHVEAKAATCTKDGNIEYWKCSEGDDPCGLRFTDKEAKRWVHQEGTVEHALGHDWGEWETVKQATETEAGLLKRVCANDETHVQFRLVPKTGHVHVLVKVEAKAPTCTQEGNIEYWQCSDESCGLCYKDVAGGEWVAEEDTVLAALGHEWGEATYEWSSDDTQVTATHNCLRDATHSESETATAESVVYAPPTCMVAGKALVISQLFEIEGFMPQAKAGPDVPALGHEWGEWTVVTPATETEEGLEQHTCARCGGVETRAIPAEVAYRYVGPDGPSWTKGDADALALTFKRSLADELTFGLFAGITIDGVAVPEKDASGAVNYAVEAGSLVLKLQPAFLETLSVGDHEVKVLFEDGSASAVVAVKAAPSSEGDGKTTTKPASATTSTAKTGDMLPIAILAVMAIVAALALAVVVIARRKR
ncbi:MAG: hypothetical protein J6S36_02580, partial [Eggerthellaceae bacterium]|nr:hypothetical protein [Eggerthellaceae bacterium]